MVGADKAWAQGFRGNGVIIGVYDQSAQGDHMEYADRWLGGYAVDGSPYELKQNHAHGTHVTGIIAGKNVGVANGALIYNANWVVPAESDSTFANGFDWLTSKRVRAVNNSWGFNVTNPSTGESKSKTVFDVTRDEIALNSPNMLEALRDSVDADIIQVFATGNDGFTQPSYLAGLPLFFPELERNWLAVTSVGPSGKKAGYAQMCGAAMQWCLTAPGGDGEVDSNDAIWSSYPIGGYASINGTSMATPHVTGAIAIAAEIFPTASGAELQKLILQTATDIGADGVDDVYGWGLLNIGNIVASIDPSNSTIFSNAAWARANTFDLVDGVMRQNLRSPRAFPNKSVLGQDTGIGAASDIQSQDAVDTRAMWLAPIYGIANMDSHSAVTGLLGGVDIFKDDSKQFGLSLGYSHTTITAHDGDDRGQAKSLHIGAYGSLMHEDWFASGTGQVSLFDQNIERGYILGATGASVDPIGRSSVLGAGIGMTLEAGRQFETNLGFKLSPYLGMKAQWQGTRSAYENGAGVFSLDLLANSWGQVEAGAGLRLQTDLLAFYDQFLQFTTDISYAQIIGDTAYANTSQLLGRDIIGRSIDMGHEVLRFDAKLDLTRETGMNLSASYNGAFRHATSSHALSLGFKASF